MASRLRNLKIDKVDRVENPANSGARIVLYKSEAAELPTQKEAPVADETNTVAQADHDAVIAERDALAAEVETLKAAQSPAEEIDKSELPEPVRKAIEENETLKAEVAQIRKERRAETFVRKAAEFASVAPADELAPILDLVDAADPELAKSLDRILSGAAARVTEGGVFKEFGAAVEPDEDTLKADALIRKHMADDNIDYKAAASKVFKAHPELYPVSKSV